MGPGPPQHFGKRFGGEFAGPQVVGGDEGNVVIAVEPGVENGHGNAHLRCATNDSHQGRALCRGEDNAVHAAVDHRIDNLDLTREFGFLRRPIPQDLDIEVSPGHHHSGINRLPEDRRRTLGRHADNPLAGSVASHGCPQ